MKRNRKNVAFEIKRRASIKINEKLKAEGSSLRYMPYTLIDRGCYVSAGNGRTYYKRWYSANREGMLKRLKKMKKIKRCL